MNWGIFEPDNGEVHICPLNDLRDHVKDRICWCHPTEDEGLWVHHSLDQREIVEQGARTH